MKLEQSFEVDAPLERVWEALVDVERVAPALPGAAVTGRNEDGTYGGTFTVKIGPTTASYTGKLVMEEIDEKAHRAVMQANGSDKRGQGGAKATIVSTLSAGDGGGTRVEVSTDYHITGRLARFGRGGMIEDISEKLLREFANRLQEELGGDGGASAPEAAAPAPDEPAPLETEATPAPPSEDQAPVDEGAPEEPAAEEPAAEEPAAEEPAAEGVLAEGASAGPPPPPPPPPPPQPVAPAEPLDAGSLVGSVLLDRVKRNPLPMAFLAGLLFAIAILRRRRHE